MKYVSLFMGAIFIAMLLLGCEHLSTNETINSSEIYKTTTETIYIDDLKIISQVGTFYSKNWNDKKGTYYQCVIPDAKAAISVASAIFSNMQIAETTSKFAPISVFYDVPDGIWIVTFGQRSETGELIMMVGDGYSIALQENDGSVVRIWANE